MNIHDVNARKDAYVNVLSRNNVQHLKKTLHNTVDAAAN